MKKKIIVLIIVLIIVFFGFWFWKKRAPEDQYQTAKAQVKDIVQTVSVTGTVQAVERADLAFESTGTITDVYVKVGDDVKKGDKIVKINGSSLFSTLKEYEAALAVKQEQLDNMRRHWNDYTPDEQDAQKKAVEGAAASVQKAKVNLGKTTIYSPMDGIVTKRYVEPASVAVAGTTVISVIAPGNLEIEVDIPESDIALMEIGQKATVELDAFNDHEKFSAILAEIDPSSTEISDVVYYKATLRFDNFDSRFKDGMSADVDVFTAQRKGVLTVPSRAVKDGTGQYHVELKTPDGIFKEVNVQTGLKGDDGDLEIISGLKEGDEVVTVKKIEK